eukprot:gene1302-752_t
MLKLMFCFSDIYYVISRMMLLGGSSGFFFLFRHTFSEARMPAVHNIYIYSSTSNQVLSSAWTKQQHKPLLVPFHHDSHVLFVYWKTDVQVAEVLEVTMK